MLYPCLYPDFKRFKITEEKNPTEESVLTLLDYYLSTNYTFLNSLFTDKMKQCLHSLHHLSMFIILLQKLQIQYSHLIT